MSGFRFRRPEPEEAAVLAALHVQCWRESLTEILPPEVVAGFDTAKMTTNWAQHLGDPSRLIVAAYSADVPVGFVHAEPRRDHGQDGHVAALYIAQSQHRKGLGRLLMGLAAREWQARGGQGLSLGVLEANTKARAFYETLGGVKAWAGSYDWDGHPLPYVLYHYTDLPALASSARDVPDPG